MPAPDLALWVKIGEQARACDRYQEDGLRNLHIVFLLLPHLYAFCFLCLFLSSVFPTHVATKSRSIFARKAQVRSRLRRLVYGMVENKDS